MDKKDALDHLVSDWARERPDLDAGPMHVVGRILQLGKKLEKRAGAALKDSGIYYTDLDVLATLRRSGMPYQLTPTQLRESVLVTSGAMTALLERLEKMELIRRLPDDNDGRVKLAELTPKGKRIIDVSIEKRFSEAADAIKSLNRDEREFMSKTLKKILISIS